MKGKLFEKLLLKLSILDYRATLRNALLAGLIWVDVFSIEFPEIFCECSIVFDYSTQLNQISFYYKYECVRLIRRSMISVIFSKY